MGEEPSEPITLDDRLMHDLCRETQEISDFVDASKREIEKLKFMRPDQIAFMAARISAEVTRRVLTQLLDNQVRIAHYLHRMHHPAAPPPLDLRLVEKPTTEKSS